MIKKKQQDRSAIAAAKSKPRELLGCNRGSRKSAANIKIAHLFHSVFQEDSSRKFREHDGGCTAS
jgi:hypothetical protein